MLSKFATRKHHSDPALCDSILGGGMLNWKVRYSKILEQNEDLFDASRSVLEVGSGNVGIAPYVRRRVIGLEPHFVEPLNEWLAPKIGSILDIPFPENSFDIVLCVDVFEHLPKSDRLHALNELVRVARGKVVISCPCGVVSERGEQALLNLFESTHSDVPSWLKEHLQNGLPRVGDMFAYLANTGLEFEVLGNETMMQHYAGVILDYFFPFAREMQIIQADKTAIAPPIGQGDWDYYYSFLFTLKKNSKKRAKTGLREADMSTFEFVPSEAPIYCIYHKPFPVAHLARVTPIFAGPAADLAGPEALTDITRGEARLPNGRWSELSAYYRVWREGPRSETVGFCHYRRLFNFRAENPAERETRLSLEDVADHSDAYYDEKLIELAKGDVVICPPPVNLGMTIWDQYCSSHNSRDWCWVISKIVDSYPCLVPFVENQFNTNFIYLQNTFVTNWALFDQICSLWFHLLREFERATPPRNNNAYQGRDISFLAERVFDAWIRYRASIGTRIIEVPIFYIESDRDKLIADHGPLIAEREASRKKVAFFGPWLTRTERVLKSHLPDRAKRLLKSHLAKFG